MDWTNAPAGSVSALRPDRAASAIIMPRISAAAMASTESSRVTSVPSSRLGKNLATNERSIGLTTGGNKSGATNAASRLLGRLDVEPLRRRILAEPLAEQIRIFLVTRAVA